MGLNNVFRDLTLVQKGGALLGLTALVGSAAFGFGRLNKAPNTSGRGALSVLAGTSKGSDFERIGVLLDNPEQIFKKAGYTPLWTASQSEASSRLPRGLKVAPKAARVWEDWFRKHLTNGGQQLSTAQLLQVKWTVAQTVAGDSACQFRPPQSISEIAKNVEKARLTALKSLGIDNPSSVITQMTRADASCAWVKSQRHYGDEATAVFFDRVENAQKRYVTAAELNSKDYSVDCKYSSLAMIYLSREMEKADPSGLKVGSTYVFLYTPDGKMGLHGINGVKITIPGGGSANLYYDPTASGKGAFGNGNLNILSRDLGPLDQASIEKLVNEHCIAVIKDSPYENKTNMQVVTYDYVLGENWPTFGLGNFDRSACPDYGITGGGVDYVSREKGTVTFAAYHKANLPKIASLDKAVDQAFVGNL